MNVCLWKKILTEHCQIVGLDGTSLIVIADNPHWVTRFRFFIPDLVVKLRNYPDLKNIRAICCKVRPPLYNATPKKAKQQLKISSHTAEILRETAAKVQDEKLKKSLVKLAGNSGSHCVIPAKAGTHSE